MNQVKEADFFHEIEASQRLNDKLVEERDTANAKTEVG